MCKYLLDLDLTLMNIWRDNYYLESDYNSKTKLSIILSFAYIGAQSDLTQVMTLNKNILDSAAELMRTKEEQCLKWFVKLWKVTQFCRTVYVISWTVALILSSRKLWIWNTCGYYSKTLLVEQGTFLYEVGLDSAEKRDILNTGFWHQEEFNVENMFIDELCIFRIVTYLWMGGIRRGE